MADRAPASTRDLVVAFGVERLPVTDLVDTDLAQIGWSGSPLHVRQVAAELERVVDGEAEYLAVRAPDGTPVAKCGIDLAAFPDAGVIHQLATRADLRRLGVASRLIAAAEARIRDRGLMTAMLSVERDNPRARGLYERLGYVVCGERGSSWEAQREDGSTFLYETELIDMKKPVRERVSVRRRTRRARRGR